METNTVKQRLALYKEALFDYKAGESLALRSGFCYYFIVEHDIVNMYDTLVELSVGRPKGLCFWFKEKGPTIHRIKALEKAIQRCEQQLKAK